MVDLEKWWDDCGGEFDDFANQALKINLYHDPYYRFWRVPKIIAIAEKYRKEGMNRMRTIKGTTRKLFRVDFEEDLDDENISDTYESMAEELIENNSWSEVYACWYDYLINECKTEEEVLNFANLFWLYEGQKRYIPNAVEFCSYFYGCVSFEHYPDAIDILDSITLDVFENSWVYPNKKTLL